MRHFIENLELDSVTGLYTKNSFIGVLKHRMGVDADENLNVDLNKSENEKSGLDEYSEGAVTQRKLLIFNVDINNFKHINIVHGTDFGDLVLKEVARIITGSGFEFAARVAGDKFLIGHISASNEPAAELGDLMLKLFDTMLVDGKKIKISVSIGAAEFDSGKTGSMTIDELIQNAEIAMFAAKKSYNRTAIFFNERMGAEARRGAEIFMELRQAIDSGGLRLCYQPEQSLKTGKIVAFEALLRMESQVIGEVMPVDFIPAAEQSGVIIELGYWVLQEVCDFITTLIKDGVEFGTVSINVSPIQLSDAPFLRRFIHILNTNGVDPKYIQVEITEGALIERVDEKIEILTELRKSGIKIALDDFGVTYSTLAYLASLPVDIVKVDKSFVLDMKNGGRKQIILQTIIELSHSLGFQVVAEGVETLDVKDALARLGCDVIQGYYLSSPIEQNDVIDFLKNFQSY